jgi:hypothetical protein
MAAVTCQSPPDALPNETPGTSGRAASKPSQRRAKKEGLWRDNRRLCSVSPVNLSVSLVHLSIQLATGAMSEAHTSDLQLRLPTHWSMCNRATVLQFLSFLRFGALGLRDDF